MKAFPNSRVGIVIAVTGLLLARAGVCQQPFQISGGEVLVFQGGTNMVRLQQSGYLEAFLTDALAEGKPKFYDLSWEADTVFKQGSVVERWRKDGFGDRIEQLERLGATTVLAQFGMLESMAGMEGLASFTNAYHKLIDDYQIAQLRVVLISPTRFEAPDSTLVPDISHHNRVLALYVAAIKQIAIEREATFVDLYHHEQQKNTPTRLTRNGMHLTPAAQADVAGRIAEQMGISFSPVEKLEPLLTAIREKHRLWYDYWRPANWKLLYGDDSRRQFTKASQGQVPFREEWKRLLPMIQEAEQRVWTIASGGIDPGNNRPEPEQLHGDQTADIQQELAAFTLPEGLSVNLFASDAEGLTSPLAIRWDAAGRMYVTVTTTYPHVFPGDVPNDKIIVLEDTNQDGIADKSTVFAEGLNIPTGIELGDGGVYVGQNTELLFLKDTNGDGKADHRRVLLSGFGNGDSHQTINSFVWSPGGELFMGQGDGIESRVETPWGSSDLFQAGFYRLRPSRLQMHPLLDDFMGPGNPWGVEFDDWGQIFSIDGAGGVTHLSLGQIPAHRRLRLGRIGEPGGYCGISHLDGQHLPSSLHGQFAIGDYKSNRVKCFSVMAEGAGFKLQWQPPILQSSHRNFRPVDVRMGPDGALYIVDWYNPVTCHQDDMYRDPRRDKAHGRIRRISSSRPAIRPPNLRQADDHAVVAALAATERWTRYQAKREMSGRDRGDIASALDQWINSLPTQSSDYEHHLYEALGAYATIEVINTALLGRLLEARDPRARAFAARIAGRWHDRLENAIPLLSRRVDDDNAQVRMEAIAALASIPQPESITAVAEAVDHLIDGSLNYVLSQAIHHLKPHWEPALRQGRLEFTSPHHLAEILKRADSESLIDDLRKLVNAEDQNIAITSGLIGTLVSLGHPEDLSEYGLNIKRFTRQARHRADLHAVVLEKIIHAVESQQATPSENPTNALQEMLGSRNEELVTRAIMLAGLWNCLPLSKQIQRIAENRTKSNQVRAAAFRALARMQVDAVQDLLVSYVDNPESNSIAIRAAAIQALTDVDLTVSAQLAVKSFADPAIPSADITSILTAFLNRQGGPSALASAIQNASLKQDTGRAIMHALFSTGRSDNVLLVALNHAIGVEKLELEFSSEKLAALANGAQNTGVASRGSVLYQRLSCKSCHRISGSGGQVGPDLTAIGTTLSPERITEELLWPNRQIKEGYTTLQVLTSDGKIHQGYERRTRESQKNGSVILQELATNRMITLKKQDIEVQQQAGSPMPMGLTSVLSEPQLLDLIRYLSELGKIK